MVCLFINTCCCCCSVAKSCPTLCDPMDFSTSGFPVLHYLPEIAQTHVHWVSDAIQPFILCHPLLLSPSVFPSMRVFSNESTLPVMWAKYWSFSFSISPSNVCSGVRVHWVASVMFLWDPLDCSPPGSSVHGILQARILEWFAMPSSKESSWPRDQTCISCNSCIAGGFFMAEPWEGKPRIFRVSTWKSLNLLYLLSLHMNQKTSDIFPVVQLRCLYKHQ